jgi:hypothetical protein
MRAEQLSGSGMILPVQWLLACWPRCTKTPPRKKLPNSHHRTRAALAYSVRGMADDLFARYGDSDSEESARDDS